MSFKTAAKTLRKAIFLTAFLLLIFFVKIPSANASVSYSPNADQIDETVKEVTITFTGLIPNKKYGLCSKANFAECGLDGLVEAYQADSNGVYQISVCGDGPNKVKIACNPDKDYFHGGNVYLITLGDWASHFFSPAQFYVHYYYPEAENIHITPDKPTPGSPITVTIAQNKLRAGSAYYDDRNQYKLILERNDSDFSTDTKCDDNSKIKQPNTPISLSITAPEASSYTLSIQGCEDEDVIFYQALVMVDPTDGSVGELVQNKGIDSPDDAMETYLPPPPPPCAVFGLNGHCETVRTAIGDIDTSPAGFVGSVFSLVLGLSGGLALLLIIYGGYQLMMARGKPEALEAARDQITAAIIGLLFIIFSLVLLQLIGFNILRIPEFGP